MKIFKIFTGVITAVSMLLTMTVAQAGTISYFERVTTNASVDLSSQFSIDYSLVDIFDADGNLVQANGGVSFTFYNDAQVIETDDGTITNASITDVYFDTGYDPALFSSLSVGADSGDGVEFVQGAVPGELTGNGSIGFTTDTGLSAGSTSPTAPNGIDTTNEWASFIGIFGTDANGNAYDFSDVESAILAGIFRVGIKVQSIYDPVNCGVGDLDCESDSYVSTVPVPAAAWLFGTAMLGFFASSRRKNNS